MGLHIYGSGNDITQTADLLACGTAGTGIRVDGEANTLRIAPGVRVSADGAYGTGLLLAYGKGQNVVSRGEIRATGTGGAGARFDFGGSLLGLDSGLTAEYRGSYIRSRTEAAEDESGNIVTQLYERYELLDELKGPLAERFDVSGPLSGNAAAIYISRNAWVKNINIVNGAALSGDIISDWNPGNSDVQQDQAAANGDDLLTSLSFGRLAAGDGSATDAPDPDFRPALRRQHTRQAQHQDVRRRRRAVLQRAGRGAGCERKGGRDPERQCRVHPERPRQRLRLRRRHLHQRGYRRPRQ